jgi:hypothetical protein
MSSKEVGAFPIERTASDNRELRLAANDAARPRGLGPVAAAGEPPEVLHDAHGFLMATWKNVALHVWTARATFALVDTLDELSGRFTSTHPEGISAVHVIANNTPLPGKDVRERLTQVTNRHAKQLACVCHVVEGSGFWASALHSFLTGLHFLTRGPFKLHICSEIPAAARWLPEPHARRTKVSFEAEELEQALTGLRRSARRVE